MEEIGLRRWNTTRSTRGPRGVVFQPGFAISLVRPLHTATRRPPQPERTTMLIALILTLLATTLLLLGAALLGRAAARTERELAGLRIVLPQIL